MRKVYEPLGWVLVTMGIILLIFIFIKLYSLTHIANNGEKIDGELTGAVGSFISGTVGVLFSLSAVIFFVVALHSQKEELELQRKELNQTRGIFKLQAFETTFFNLMQAQQNLRTQLINSKTNKQAELYSKISVEEPNFVFLSSQLDNDLDYLNVETIKRLYAENDAFGEINANLLSIEGFASVYCGIDYQLLELEGLGYVYKRFIEIYKDVLPHYFNTLYFIFKFIKDTDTEISNNIILHTGFQRDKYVNFIKSQMSRPEMYLIEQHSFAYPNFKELLDSLDFFINIDENTYLMN